MNELEEVAIKTNSSTIQRSTILRIAISAILFLVFIAGTVPLVRNYKAIEHLKSFDPNPTFNSENFISSLPESIRELAENHLSNKFVIALSDITHFDACDSEISDNDLSFFRKNSLILLSLSNTNTGDSGLKYLAIQKNLGVLDLSGTEVTDNGMAHLKNMTEMFYLRLNGTSVSNIGLQNCQNMESMFSLDLSDTKISDLGLKHLHKMTKLYVLALDHTDITDHGLLELTNFNKLKHLSLRGTNVTEEAIRSLQFQLPNCEIKY